MSVKILHCSDLHIGSPLTGMGEKAGTRRAELLLAFSQITRICREEAVDLLLMAGDIFDSVQVDKEEADLVRQSLEALPRTRVFIAPGNHDPATVDSPYLTLDWPENVHIFKGPMESIELPDVGARVYGAGFTGERMETSLLKGVKATEDYLINICVLHGDFSQHSPYGPIALSEIAQSGMDYLALGHIHQQTGILKEGGTFYAYCGCPEGRGFDELGEKGVYLGELEKGVCGLEFRKICKRQFLELSVDVGSCDTQNQMLTAIEEAVERTPDFPQNFYKIKLLGEVPPETVPRLDLLENMLAQKLFFLKLRDETHMRVDLELLAEEMSLKGVFAKKLRAGLSAARAAGDEAQEALFLDALKVGLKAFEGEVSFHAN